MLATSKPLLNRYIFLAILISICLFFTASRNLLGILITIYLAVLPMRGKWWLTCLKYMAFGLIIALISLIIVTTVWCVFPASIDYDEEHRVGCLSINKAPSLYAVLYKMSIRFISQKPFIGVGPGMFGQTLARSLDWNEVEDTYKAKGFTDTNIPLDPHSTYLGWAAEAGIPFIALLTAFLFCLGRLMWRKYKDDTRSFAGKFSYLSLCGLIGFAVNAWYIDILTMRHFWIMMGLATLVAMGRLSDGSKLSIGEK